MLPDEYGFLYPLIDEAICIDCGACRRVCAYRREVGGFLNEPAKAFAAVNLNAEVLWASSSGGAFSAIAEVVIEEGGLVFGCTLDSNLVARHISVESVSELEKLRGSKYLQSKIESSYAETRIALNKGRKVLFVGTPCQIAGLKAFLQNDYNNLLTIDLFCHGISSRDFFAKYIKYLEKHYKSKVIDFKCRDKSRLGWGMAGLMTMNKNGKTFERPLWPRINYYYYYVKGDTYRETCYDCRYSEIGRPGDFTIGDFWRIEEVLPSLPRKAGVSALLINTKKGLDMLESLERKMKLTEVSITNVASSSFRLNDPFKKSGIRKQILDCLCNSGFEEVAKSYYGTNATTYVKAYLNTKVPAGIRKKLKAAFRKITRKSG